jgi:hypothetical protein
MPESMPRRKSGRQRDEQLIYATVALHKDDLAALDACALAEGRSRSDLIRCAIRQVWVNGSKRRAG